MGLDLIHFEGGMGVLHPVLSISVRAHAYPIHFGQLVI